MSRLPRATDSLLRPAQSSWKPSALAPRRTTVLANFSTRHAESSPEDHRLSYTSLRVSDSDDARFATHLNSVFRSLEFPPELARRILTHGSHKAAIHGHNGRLGFIGGYLFNQNCFLFLVVDVCFYGMSTDRPPCLGIIFPIVRPRSCTRPCKLRL